MRASIGILSVIALLGTGSLEAQELRADSWKWYFGVTGGGLMTQTQTQDYTMMPNVGAHIMVVGKIGGVMLSFDESFGDNEQSAFAFIYQDQDSSSVFAAHAAGFDRIRRYSGSMMAFPLRAKLEPYLGVGFGLMHTVGTRIESDVPTLIEAIKADSVLNVRNSTGFGALLGGVQYGAGNAVVVYGQYQITTSPAGGNLLSGPTHSFQFGLRLRLGRAKDDIRGGGY